MARIFERLLLARNMPDETGAGRLREWFSVVVEGGGGRKTRADFSVA
jgi:hypothetical protein